MFGTIINDIINKFKKPVTVEDIAYKLFLKSNKMSDSGIIRGVFKDLYEESDQYYIEAKNIMRIKKLNKIKEKCLKKVI